VSAAIMAEASPALHSPFGEHSERADSIVAAIQLSAAATRERPKVTRASVFSLLAGEFRVELSKSAETSQFS
jgi:hypothetical protein